MASIDFITKRVEGKEKELAKLQKKMERILAAKATNWEKNPYYYGEDDIRRTQKDIDAATKSLEKFRTELVQEKEKAASRNIQVIIDFLDNWKVKSVEYYRQTLPKYLEARKADQQEEDKYWAAWKSGQFRGDKEGYNRARHERDARKQKFQSTWGWIQMYVGYMDTLDIDKLQKDLDREAIRKYDFIIERTNEIVGQIIDASYLRISNNGELNGFIYGTKGKASVSTIGAGGYNIQRFHFRTLVHEYK